MRLLHNMVGRVFFPKTGRFDWVTEKDIAFIYYLSKGQPINLPYLMINQMKEAARKMRFCLSYGMVFTLIFEEFGVDFTGEDAKRLLHTDRYTERTLHRMGIHKVEGRWVRRVSGQQGAETDSDEEIVRAAAAETEEEAEADVEADEDDEPDDADDDEPFDGSAPEAPEVAAGPSTIFPEIDSHRTPPATPQPASATGPSAPYSTGISADQFSQLSDILCGQMRTLLGEMRQELSQSHQEVSRSYQELRGDLRDLTLRVEILEQR